MNYQIICEGSYPALEVTLNQGDTLVTEAGAMAWMDPGIEVKTKSRGGIGASLKRGVLGGESFFQNEYSAQRDGAKIALVSGPAGDIHATEMDGENLILERGAYLASGPNVVLDSKFQGMKGLFAEGLFVLQASGSGTMFWTGYGDIHQIEISGEYVVDNGYAVAWDASLDYSISRTGKKLSSFVFGDQLVMRFNGHGRLWVQSRSA